MTSGTRWRARRYRRIASSDGAQYGIVECPRLRDIDGANGDVVDHGLLPLRAANLISGAMLYFAYPALGGLYPRGSVLEIDLNWKKP